MMIGEKAEQPSKSSKEPDAAVEAAMDSSVGNSEEQEKGTTKPGLTTQTDFSNLGYDPQDTKLGLWTLEKHLHAIVNELSEHNLPPMSSKSSVIWRDLLVRGAGAGVTYQRTVGEILRGPVTGIQGLMRKGKPPERVILHNLEGLVREGEMLLVLGRPGSGCSTLLKSLCGLTDEYLGWQGEVKYNGVDVDTIKARFRGDVVYTSEG
jgi:ABC-type multidrug transport system fused ATPase/permease subunit